MGKHHNSPSFAVEKSSSLHRSKLSDSITGGVSLCRAIRSHRSANGPQAVFISMPTGNSQHSSSPLLPSSPSVTGAFGQSGRRRHPPTVRSGFPVRRLRRRISAGAMPTFRWSGWHAARAPHFPSPISYLKSCSMSAIGRNSFIGWSGNGKKLSRS